MIKPAKQFQQIPNEFLRNNLKLTNSALRVMLALVTYDPCHPDYKTLMLNTGLSRPSVAAAIKELKEAGYLLYKKGNSHRKQANQYTLTWNPVPLVQVKNINSISDIKLNNLTQSPSSSSKNELNVPAQVECIESERVQVKNINSNNSNIYKDNTLELNKLTHEITPSELVAPQATDVNNNGNQDITYIPVNPFLNSFTVSLQHYMVNPISNLTNLLNPVRFEFESDKALYKAVMNLNKVKEFLNKKLVYTGFDQGDYKYQIPDVHNYLLSYNKLEWFKNNHEMFKCYGLNKDDVLKIVEG